MEKIKVKRQARKHIYAHNDLSNAAYHFKKRIDKRLANDERDGIAFDILAELIFLAFTMEAKINFLGYRLVAEWKKKEQMSLMGKLNTVEARFFEKCLAASHELMPLAASVFSQISQRFSRVSGDLTVAVYFSARSVARRQSGCRRGSDD